MTRERLTDRRVTVSTGNAVLHYDPKAETLVLFRGRHFARLDIADILADRATAEKACAVFSDIVADIRDALTE